MTSDISCQSCRRRKVKCDRRLPQCSVCEKTAQECIYPPGALKPGPKIGSKRLRQDNPSTGNILDTSRKRLEAASELASHRNFYMDKSLLSSVGKREANKSFARAQDGSMHRTLDLSFILHPAHEASSPSKEQVSNPRSQQDSTQSFMAIDKARSIINISQEALERLLTTYFDNMVAINLFHEPSFSDKLRKVSSPIQICALLTALRLFAARFNLDGDSGNQADTTSKRTADYLDQTTYYISEALKECGDSAPSMCILQACIVSTHCQLSQGVLGKAWRSLGTCVRLAYEMNLHLVDVEALHDVPEAHAEKWCEDEEKRRAWWAIWEMDVFATTIRRTPTAIDWSQMDILLPTEDSYWFERKPRRSCFLEMDPVSRWKTLQHSGNQSPKAWFIVINSLMKDAQRISSPRGVPGTQKPDKALHSSTDRRGSHTCQMDAARRKLEVIENAVQCFRLALPSHLKYHSQYLGFEARTARQYISARQEHCSIYNIHMMTQLARLMIYRFDAFRNRFRATMSSYDADIPASSCEKTRTKEKRGRTESLATKQYFEAADELLLIVRRSCDDHVRYINPFLSSTIWLASAALLVRSQLCQSEATKLAIKSRYEVMHLTFKRCVNFWEMQTAVQQSLDALKQRLEECGQLDRSEWEPRKHYREPQRKDSCPSAANNTQQPLRQLGQQSYFSRNEPEFHDSLMLESSTTNPYYQPAQSSLSPISGYRAQQAAFSDEALIDTFAQGSTHLLYPQRVDLRSTTSSPPAQMSGIIDPLILSNTAQPNATGLQDIEDSTHIGLDFDWTYARLPDDLPDMLSEFFT